MENYCAESLFQPSNLVKALENTTRPPPGYSIHLMGTIVSIPHIVSARTVAVLGYDFVVDAQHTPTDGENLVGLNQIISLSSQGRTVPIHRIRGTIFPHIDMPEQAAEAVSKSSAVLVPRVTGTTAMGLCHAHVVDNNIATIVQIESPLAPENADAIATVPGMKTLMLGAGNLRVAMHRLVSVSRRHWKPLAVVPYFQLLMLTSDHLSVVKGHKEDLAQMTKTIAEVHGLKN
ncbi:Pyruvate/Phosphoenolpyruvate kinase-like domain-containing protein [Aspergillus alliaceus]|uniref:Pyruvate/Phosphoenolpyruvate kinase-like domain-containing protein n=1 Tax=Petromyces alliaceus TaxID=209559 RepID=A0A5N7BVV8_PETAA|nr:Pyruvate/Phosphoenolpyruvate kinase-like domain-containing protein [Aspergillus alliaceus]